MDRRDFFKIVPGLALVSPFLKSKSQGYWYWPLGATYEEGTWIHGVCVWPRCLTPDEVNGLYALELRSK
jgi:hypothetical protein